MENQIMGQQEAKHIAHEWWLLDYRCTPITQAIDTLWQLQARDSSGEKEDDLWLRPFTQACSLVHSFSARELKISRRTAFWPRLCALYES